MQKITMTIKIKDSQNLDFLIELLSKFSFVEEIATSPKQNNLNLALPSLPFRQPTGKPSISDFAGLWQNNPKTIEQLRAAGWKRNL